MPIMNVFIFVCSKDENIVCDVEFLIFLQTEIDLKLFTFLCVWEMEKRVVKKKKVTS